MSKNNFQEYNFKEYIKKGLTAIGFKEATQIQEIVIPKVLNGINVIGKSKTGTGKTHAFLLPILQKLNEDNHEVQAVVISPTRELASQLYNEFQKITVYSTKQIDIRMYIGGTNRDNEIERLEKSQPQIVIGTIGKLKDLVVTQNCLKIHTARIVVIDEADMVFEESEIVDIDYVFAKFKFPQILSFSATIPQEVIIFLNKYITKNEVVDLIGNDPTVANISHYFIPTKNKDKMLILTELLKGINPYLVLIFANTVLKVDEISENLSKEGFRVAKITGSLEPRERKQILRRIKDGEFQYVVASDIASRGIDIEGVSHVVNYELPSDIEFYVHRIGRTARLNNTGMAISFYDYDDENYLKSLSAKNIKYKFMKLTDGELIPTKERNRDVKKDNEFEESIHKKYPLDKKVKPGYRKKRNEVINKELRKAKRERIDNIYKRINKKKTDK